MWSANLRRALDILARLDSEGKLSANEQGWIEALRNRLSALDKDAQ